MKVNPSPREKGGSAVAATPAAGALRATAKPAIATAGGRAPKATNEKERQLVSAGQRITSFRRGGEENDRRPPACLAVNIGA